MNKELTWIFLTALIYLLSAFALAYAEPCEEDKSFGCEVFVTCYPCEEGWCYYKHITEEKKKELAFINTGD